MMRHPLFGLCLGLIFGINALFSAAVPGAIPINQTEDEAENTEDAVPTFLAADGAASDTFGHAIAISGNTTVIGAYNQAGGHGAVYIYSRSGITWTEQQKLTASDSAELDLFGYSVAIAGDTLIVGAYGKNSSQGAAYIFTHTDGIWTEQQKLTASDGESGDYFGTSVAITGDTVIVGASQKRNGQGAAYIFTRTEATWTEQQKLTASDHASGDWFGHAVALTDDTAIIGAHGKNERRGTAYVFTRTDTTWREQQQLIPTAGSDLGFFGVSVAVSGNTAVIGAIYDRNNQGTAYIFIRTGDTWAEQQRLTAREGEPSDYFGGTVAIAGDTIVVGVASRISRRGLVGVFTRKGTAWSQYELLAITDGVNEDYFGTTVAVDNGTALVGASADDVGTNIDQGSVWAFLVPSSDPDAMIFPAIGVTSFTLINARTDEDIKVLVDGDVIDELELGTNKFNIRANTNPEVVGSVIFAVDNRSRYRLRNDAPYMIAGSRDGDIYAWEVEPGRHIITATAYTLKNGGGLVGTSLTIRITVVSSESPTSTP